MYNNIPKLDLHGCDRVYASILIKEFINDNIKLRNKKVVIIHGKGTGILKKTVLNDLKKNKSVLNYELNMFNDGETIVTLKKRV